MHAVETRDRSKAVWTDADRAWVYRAAAEAVDEQANADAAIHSTSVNGGPQMTLRTPCDPASRCRSRRVTLKVRVAGDLRVGK